jgi:uncharacterized protein YbjT (DUF2867 family)
MILVTGATGTNGRLVAHALLELNTYARQGHASVVTDTVQRIAGRPARTLAQWFADHAASFRA